MELLASTYKVAVFAKQPLGECTVVKYNVRTTAQHHKQTHALRKDSYSSSKKLIEQENGVRRNLNILRTFYDE